ncbi:MAG: magnesium chelatase family protein [Actinomycetota bacterium]|jgi:magnesium chelatase family protein|nr:magnesium chelatase family protein [Actinomycetota bacterium]MDQ1496437.1 magnesium chelatase family protein [Actinomycetota bacterium]
MALARAWSVALAGVQGTVVEVEADLAPGLPGLTIIGLPDAALSESRDRVRAALLNSGEAWPQRRITLGLSPATLPKHGSGFDLSMAVSVLSAAGVLPRQALEGIVLFGELGLDGRVRPIRGVLPAAMAACAAGFDTVVVPRPNAAEAALVPDLKVWAVGSLRELLCSLRTGRPPEAAAYDDPEVNLPASALAARTLEVEPDLADVLGQPSGRRAVEVAAAGGHHMLLLGDPGTGKTMLAARLPGLLPALDRTAALEVTAVHSIAGVLPADCPLIVRPPFRDPHHTTSVAALVGGGSGMARPGVASLAHHGVLFLDEAPEFATGVLDALRQPLEAGHVTIARSGGVARYPARFLLVMAANPCGCSTSNAASGCTCSPLTRRRYLSRLSGPLLDRVDLQVRMDPVSRSELLADSRHVEHTDTVAERVLVARSRAADRLAGSPWRTNSDIPGRELRDRWAPARTALVAAERALDAGRLSARGLDRVLRVAWTLADLADRDQPVADDVDEALYLRTGVAA